ncbi:MAG: type IV pilus secretin PilQ [Bdellovibrionales bacterium]|nr:type IV pilus secretin PilQ [Bdellovibrionales bacterium]
MKKHIVLLFIYYLFIMNSCQTMKSPSDSQEQPDGVEEAADLIEEGSKEDSVVDEEDLESEFADSEDFEQEMADSAFPSEEEPEESKEEVTEQETLEASPPDEEDMEEETIAADTKEEEADIAATEITEEPEEDITDDMDSTEPTESSTSVAVINNIRYEAGENKVYVDGTGSFSYQSRENKANNQFIIEIPEAVLSDSLQERPFVMKDFSTQMALLQADQKDSDTVRIIVQMRENASMPSVHVSDTGSLVISSGASGMMVGQTKEGLSGPSQSGLSPSSGADSYGDSNGQVLPAKSLEEFFLNTPQFTGRPISIHLKDVEVRDVLYFISEGTGLNMVLSEDVRGKISIKLRNVPWDQALVTVMKAKKLGYVREGNVIMIMSLDALKRDYEAIQKMISDQKILDPLKVKVIPVVYKKAGDMQKLMEGLVTKDRGKVIVDQHSNSLIVTDTVRAIESMETMIKNLDKSPTQVMIEAKVIEARERFVRNLGISWNFDGTPLSVTPDNPQLNLDVDGGLEVFPGGVSTGRTASTGLRVSFAPVGDLDFTLGLSEAEDLINVISAPRIMVLNGETAKITQKTEDIDLVTSTQQGAGTQTSPQRVSADLEFEVAPQITALGSIFMDIKMKREFFGPPEAQSGSRPVNAREAETKVLVNNGQTIVIGGIYQHDETKSDEGFPILRHVPILKWLFSRFTKDEQRNELLLFLTPRIMDFKNANRLDENNQ